MLIKSDYLPSIDDWRRKGTTIFKAKSTKDGRALDDPAGSRIFRVAVENIEVALRRDIPKHRGTRQKHWRGAPKAERWEIHGTSISTEPGELIYSPRVLTTLRLTESMEGG